MSQNAPTLKANKGVMFFNAGDRISEPLSYSLPGVGDIHAIARYMIDAPENDFFYVPTELRLLSENIRVPVDFAQTVVQRMGKRGVVMIDEDFEEDEENGQTADIAIAKTEESAKEKGERLWKGYLEAICRNHIESCQKARAAGGYPREAEGFTKRALKLQGWTDPAVMILNELKQSPPTAASSDVAALLEQNRVMLAQMQQQSADNARLAAELAAIRQGNAVAALQQKKSIKKAVSKA
jgi:hypothetical protein